eukprot:TRINITY_DN24424_c0_g1_i2.p1 TRINITY_DN24424_c0_g1~~TRINITY_DN24424_c0_g1_i2.p1  ORF type:complete len:217 (-),score=50.72 TRINITY_DN24424_c0_g1_i2:345-953(-)
MPASFLRSISPLVAALRILLIFGVARAGKAPAPDFYGLHASDIDGNIFRFSVLKGVKQVVITNVASRSQSADRNYADLKALQRLDDVRVLAFPSSEFDKEEPGTDDQFKKAAQRQGLAVNTGKSNFVLMRRTRVNGPAMHTVFRFLRAFSSSDDIKGSFATKWVVTCKSKVCNIKRCDGDKLASKCAGRLKDITKHAVHDEL